MWLTRFLKKLKHTSKKTYHLPTTKRRCERSLTWPGVRGVSFDEDCIVQAILWCQCWYKMNACWVNDDHRPPTHRRRSVAVACKWMSLLSAACINPLARRVWLLNASLPAATSRCCCCCWWCRHDDTDTLLMVRKHAAATCKIKVSTCFTGFQHGMFFYTHTSLFTEKTVAHNIYI